MYIHNENGIFQDNSTDISPTYYGSAPVTGSQNSTSVYFYFSEPSGGGTGGDDQALVAAAIQEIVDLLDGSSLFGDANGTKITRTPTTYG